MSNPIYAVVVEELIHIHDDGYGSQPHNEKYKSFIRFDSKASFEEWIKRVELSNNPRSYEAFVCNKVEVKKEVKININHDV